MDSNNLKEFVNFLDSSIENKNFIKLTISKKRNKNNEVKNVFAKPIEIKIGFRISFVYRYQTKDITKNYSIEESISIIKNLLETEFFQADLFTTNENWHLIINKKNNAKLNKEDLSITKPVQFNHDKTKNKFIATENNVYLKELGILTSEWKIKKNMHDKYRQINKYIEIIDGILKSANFKQNYNIADMGSGKGYLTFALYDYLYNVLNIKPNITGVELRKELVDSCNLIAKKSEFSNLQFIEGTIENVKLTKIDLLIALHACDTATDEAIYRGIKSNAKVIVCAPCCHNQIRKQISPDNDLSLITNYGILKERQAEIITDTIRALIMEAYGYKTKVFEFIATEHTPKNVLIAGIKQEDIKTPDTKILKQIENLKAMFGIEYHYLEKLLS
ncbi:MAG: SAM-dependent methyltransferase [Bacteroidales bacterium]|jgi:SAM-dependent methyltransferase|nr:SAM-dependent methyltransferase [Bacteroidales bacterium]